jgi:hypothetical protein
MRASRASVSRIDAIIFSAAIPDEAHVPCMRDDHFVPQLG